MKIKELNIKSNDEIKAVFIEAVLMPNGEIIRNGKTISFDMEVKGIYEREVEK